MTDTSLIELVEDYGEACYEHGRLGVTYAGEDAYEKAGELLAEIRHRIESDAERLAGLERDAARYRWLRYNASFTIRSFLFGEPSMAHHAESDLDAAIDQQLESEKA